MLANFDSCLNPQVPEPVIYTIFQRGKKKKEVKHRFNGIKWVVAFSCEKQKRGLLLWGVLIKRCIYFFKHYLLAWVCSVQWQFFIYGDSINTTWKGVVIFFSLVRHTWSTKVHIIFFIWLILLFLWRAQRWMPWRKWRIRIGPMRCFESFARWKTPLSQHSPTLISPR